VADPVVKCSATQSGNLGPGSAWLGGNVAYYVADVYGTIDLEVE
jgi:hypothetical protein